MNILCYELWQILTLFYTNYVFCSTVHIVKGWKLSRKYVPIVCLKTCDTIILNLSSFNLHIQYT